MIDYSRSVTSPSYAVPAQKSGLRKAWVAVSRFFYLLPAQILISLLIGYRWAISPLYGNVCRYFPSCSAYALEAVTVHGAMKGTYLALRRLLRCHPWAAGGIDHVPGRTRPGHCEHEGSDEQTPKIIMLNHPERFLNQDALDSALSNHNGPRQSGRAA